MVGSQHEEWVHFRITWERNPLPGPPPRVLICCCCSVAQLCPTDRNPHGLQHARLPCPSLSPRVCSNSSTESMMPSNHLIFYHLLSSSPQFFPAPGSFPVRWLFPSGGQSIGASASASVPPVNMQGWFSLRLTSLISLQTKGLSRVFSNTTTWTHEFFGAQPPLWSNSYIRTWLLEKP